MFKKVIVISERIDRNGTKHQEVIEPCNRCGGAGASDRWMYTGKTCYKCGGTGQQQGKRKIYTPEHEAKLEAQREKRAEKKRLEAMAKAEEENKIKLADWGYAQEKIYAVLGDTYPIKDELKEAGAKWGGRVIGWYFSEKPSQWETIDLETSELIWYNELGQVIQKDVCRYEDYVNGRKKIFEPQSEFVGEVNDKLELDLKLDYVACIDTMYGSLYINTLKDNQGNVYVWKTSKNLTYEVGDDDRIKLKGTVRGHDTYRGVKQTNLSRCRIVK